jgi:hypothetical protein
MILGQFCGSCVREGSLVEQESEVVVGAIHQINIELAMVGNTAAFESSPQRYGALAPMGQCNMGSSRVQARQTSSSWNGSSTGAARSLSRN